MLAASPEAAIGWVPGLPGIGLSFMLALIIGPLLGARFGVPALFWFAAVLALVAETEELIRTALRHL